MAVYTDVAADELADYLSQYDIGELLSYKGIAEGVENSNFLLHTSCGFGFEVPKRTCSNMIGTSNPPHECVPITLRRAVPNAAAGRTRSLPRPRPSRHAIHTARRTRP